jgi:hypothetical protein
MFEFTVYLFLGNYNSLIDFLRDLNAAGVTSEGQHVVIAVCGDKDSPEDMSTQDVFLRKCFKIIFTRCGIIMVL